MVKLKLNVLTRALNSSFVTYPKHLPLVYVTYNFQLLQIESELWLSDWQKFIGSTNFLAHSVALFNNTKMKQMCMV